MAAANQAEQAVRLAAAAEALRDALGTIWVPPERDVYERTAETLRADLGETAFLAAWAAGRSALPGGGGRGGGSGVGSDTAGHPRGVTSTGTVCVLTPVNPVRSDCWAKAGPTGERPWTSRSTAPAPSTTTVTLAGGPVDSGPRAIEAQGSPGAVKRLRLSPRRAWRIESWLTPKSAASSCSGRISAYARIASRSSDVRRRDCYTCSAARPDALTMRHSGASAITTQAWL